MDNPRLGHGTFARLAPFSWQTIKDCTLGSLPLGRTLSVSSVHATALVLAAWLVTSIVPVESLKYDQRQLLALLPSVSYLIATVWSGQCVMRACIQRTGLGKSVVVSGMVFLGALWATAEAIVSFGGTSRQISENWYRERTNGWVPLDVLADPLLGRIVAKGDITHDSARLFEAVIRANPKLTVVQIESNGGYVNEAMEMARLIRALKLDTVSMRRCSSACTLMFVAGQNRYLGPEARFRFHRAGYAGMPPTERLEKLDQELARFYSTMGAGPEIGAGELSTPHYSFWEPSQGELLATGYATLRWSERPMGM